MADDDSPLDAHTLQALSSICSSLNLKAQSSALTASTGWESQPFDKGQSTLRSHSLTPLKTLKSNFHPPSYSDPEMNTSGTYSSSIPSLSTMETTKMCETSIQPNSSKTLISQNTSSANAASTVESATSPTEKLVTPFNIFLSQLRNVQCSSIVESIHNLVKHFPDKTSSQEAAKLMHPFINSAEELMLQIPVFKGSGMPIADLSIHIREGLEKLITQKLYNKILQSILLELDNNMSLTQTMKCFNWIEPRHLDIYIDIDPIQLDLAKQQLYRLEKVRCPKDKMILILNFCKLIIVMFESYKRSDNNHPQAAGADDFFPLLIYVIIKSAYYNIHSNVLYIQTFRHPLRLVSEEAYFLTQVLSAIEFIKGLGKTSELNISKEEFTTKYNAAMAELKLQGNFSVVELEAQSAERDTKAVHGVTLPSKTAAELSDNIDRKIDAHHIWKYINEIDSVVGQFKFKSLGDLKLNEVDLLYTEYQLLLDFKEKIIELLRN